MDTSKMRPIKDAANIGPNGWKSTECRKMMIKKIVDYLIKHGPPSWAQHLPGLIQSVERFEEKVFESSKVEPEYIAKISIKMKTTIAPFQSAESNLLASNSSGPGEESDANTEWKEHVYKQVQKLKAAYFTKLDSIYKLMSKKLQRLRHEYVPQQPKTNEMDKCEHHKKVLEYIFALLNVEKSQITLSIKQKIGRVENYIHSIVQQYVSSHYPEHIEQLFSYPSSISQVEVSQKKPTSQIMSPSRSSHLTNQISLSDNKMHLQDHLVGNQFNISQQLKNKMSIKKAMSGHGNDVQPQLGIEIISTEAFDISNPCISASLMLEDYGKVDEPIINFEDSNPTMQRLIKTLTTMSDEALMAASDDIEAMLLLDDGISTREPINIATNNSMNTNLEGVSLADSQARYLNFHDLVPMEKKMTRFIDSTPTSGSPLQFTGAEKPFSSSIVSQINQPRRVENSIFEEIKEINNLLIDTEVVITKENTIPRVVEGAEEHGEGLIVKLLFNSVTVNLHPTSQYASDKKSIIKPLHLLVPTSYPLRSPVILGERPFEISMDLDDLSMRAKLKLRFSLESKNQPLSLQTIATSWDCCVREAICEYGQLHGGGTFSSKYGGWEICPSDD